jgi:hypothetical protein
LWAFRDRPDGRARDQQHHRRLPGERPWSFTGGTIRAVAVDVSGDPYVDLERAAAATIARE